MNAPGGALGKGEADVGGMRRDEVAGGIEPDVAIKCALGANETVDERDERVADIAAVCSENRVAFGNDRRQEAIARGQPLADQRLGDRLGLMAMVEIADNAEQVSRVDGLAGAVAARCAIDSSEVECGVDLGRVVRRPVVEQQGARSYARSAFATTVTSGRAHVILTLRLDQPITRYQRAEPLVLRPTAS